MKKPKKYISYIISIILIGILVATDQFTKYLVNQKIPMRGIVPVIDPVLFFTHVENEGAAWSILSGQQIFFIVLTFVLLAAIIFLYFKTPFEKKYTPIRYVMVVITAGAIGNLIDRISTGRVVDFIDSRLVYLITKGNYNFPIYNFADICVTLSMLLLIILIFAKYKDNDFDYLKPKKKEKTFTETEVYTISKNKGETVKTPEVADVDEDFIPEEKNEQ